MIASAIFIYCLRRGFFLGISNYFRETQEELKKCTWPTWEELKGSTVVVIISIILVGGFTVGIDFVIATIVRMII